LSPAELDSFSLYASDPDLRAGKVLKNGDGSADKTGGAPDPSNHSGMAGMAAMTEV
jgi:hypothetical protein